MEAWIEERIRRFAWRVVLFAAWVSLTLLLAAGARPVFAHSWYPAACCSGTDCASIQPTSVRETAGGHVVTVAPGSHPMWRSDRPTPLVVRIPYREAKPSPDGQWHLCINGAGDLLCFFAIIGGS